MQRTVKSTRFTYVVNEINAQNEISCRIEFVEVPETDPKKALKMAFKKVGTFAPLKTETVEQLWVLEDELFFQYAHKVEPKTETTEEVQGE